LASRRKVTNAHLEKFIGSEEQISEIVESVHGCKWRDIDGKESNIVNGSSASALMILYRKSGNANVVHEYLLCNPHPHTEMIIE
jgi:hypothetical protein